MKKDEKLSHKLNKSGLNTIFLKLHVIEYTLLCNHTPH